MFPKTNAIAETAILLGAVLMSTAILLKGWTKVNAPAVGVPQIAGNVDWTREHQEQIPPPIKLAYAGDTASGRVLREVVNSTGKHELLDLDTSPCAETKVIRFHYRYEQEKIGEVECFNKKYDKVKVVQK